MDAPTWMNATDPRRIGVDCGDEESPTEYARGGYLPIAIGDSFCDGKYFVVRKLGWGHFSTVWLVRDTQSDTHAALKVVKSATKYTETARDEIRLLKQIAATKPAHPAHRYLVNLLDSFDHSSAAGLHVCMALEPLGETLLTLIESHRASGVPLKLVKSVTSQVLSGLAFLHDYCDLVHTDIKPENILISIPGVEAHIRNELLVAPQPSSRHIALLRETKTTTNGQHRSREHVRILTSQPLPSPPSSSFSRSPTTTERMTSISGLAVSPGSQASSFTNSLVASFTTLNFSTAPTSMQSDRLKSTSPKTPVPDQSLSEQLISRIVSAKPPAGPSLLSQTAPRVTPTVVKGTMAERAFDELDQLITLAQRVASAPSQKISDFPPSAFSPETVLSPPHISIMPLIDDSSDIHVKIADMGNATSSRFHFTEEVQTRQYRAPEVIIGRSDWNTKVDIWSVACLVFELVTGDMLFDPQTRARQFTKDDDHCAMIIELLGEEYEFDEAFRTGGRKGRTLFDSHGELRAIKDLNTWSLQRVLTEKYKRTVHEAEALAAFLLPMLSINPTQRANAASMLVHCWLQ